MGRYLFFILDKVKQSILVLTCDQPCAFRRPATRGKGIISRLVMFVKVIFNIFYFSIYFNNLEQNLRSS